VTMEHIARSFRVSFSIVHGSLHPDAITAALGTEPTKTKAVGAPRVSSSGSPMEGTNAMTWWNLVLDTDSAHELVPAIAKILDRLESRRDAVRTIVENGGRAELFCAVWADGNWDEEVPWELMARVSSFKINLRLDVYPEKVPWGPIAHLVE
jgi:hypothetical protein